MNGMTTCEYIYPLSISKLREGYALSKCFSFLIIYAWHRSLTIVLQLLPVLSSCAGMPLHWPEHCTSASIHYHSNNCTSDSSLFTPQQRPSELQPTLLVLTSQGCTGCTHAPIVPNPPTVFISIGSLNKVFTSRKNQKENLLHCS